MDYLHVRCQLIGRCNEDLKAELSPSEFVITLPGLCDAKDLSHHTLAMKIAHPAAHRR